LLAGALLLTPLSVMALLKWSMPLTVRVRTAKPALWLFPLFGMLAALVGARAALQVTQGLQGEYLLGPSITPALTVMTRDISTRQMTADWNGSPPPAFRARWFGFMTIGRSGLYTFATSSDDGSTLAIDGTVVVDNSGRHGLQTQTGRVWLEPGPHFILIEYTQAGGDYEMTWSWAPEGGELSRVPAWVLSPRRLSYTRALVAHVLDELTLAVLVLVGLAVSWPAAKHGRALTSRARTALRLHPVVMRSDFARVATGARRLSATVLGIAGALVISEYGTRVVVQDTASSGDAGGRNARAGGPHVSINSLGLREREIGPTSRARYRIFVIGDSYTWGQGLEEEERFSNLLERLLGPTYEVLNFGVPGDTMPGHLTELDRVLTMSPGFVLLQLYVTDFETSNMRRPRPYPLLPADWDGRLLASSFVYRLLSDRWAQLQEAVGLVDSYDGYMARHLRDPDSPDARESFGTLRQFFERARAAGVPSGAVLFPAADAMGPFGTNYPFGFLHDHVKAICTDEHVRCLDLLQAFSTLPDPRSTWVSPVDAHPNAQTNRRAAHDILGRFGPEWRH
jgi:lysophospholipase L1-like esterase